MEACSEVSAWRGFRKLRIATRPNGRPRKHPELNTFYGYPAELIAEWCCVALSTAFAYKSGHLKQSKPVAKLFRLHRDRMVLTPEWRGWFVTQDAVVDPDGNETPRGLLENYYLMVQYCRELAGRIGDEQEIAKSPRFLEVA
jgi:hypothetical protein